MLGAAVLQATLGVAVAAVGVAAFVSTVSGDEGDLTSGLAATGFALGVGGLVCYLAWGLFQLNNWARTPVVLTQIFALLAAGYLYRGEEVVVAVCLAVVATATLALTLAPATTARLFPDE